MTLQNGHSELDVVCEIFIGLPGDQTRKYSTDVHWLSQSAFNIAPTPPPQKKQKILGCFRKYPARLRGVSTIRARPLGGCRGCLPAVWLWSSISLCIVEVRSLVA
jgi:hypothetical protein